MGVNEYASFFLYAVDLLTWFELPGQLAALSHIAEDTSKLQSQGSPEKIQV